MNKVYFVSTRDKIDQYKLLGVFKGVTSAISFLKPKLDRIKERVAYIEEVQLDCPYNIRIVKTFLKTNINNKSLKIKIK
jgi:hypothetical protein